MPRFRHVAGREYQCPFGTHAPIRDPRSLTPCSAVAFVPSLAPNGSPASMHRGWLGQQRRLCTRRGSLRDPRNGQYIALGRWLQSERPPRSKLAILDAERGRTSWVSRVATARGLSCRHIVAIRNERLWLLPDREMARTCNILSGHTDKVLCK
jgi:hypothetical protein